MKNPFIDRLDEPLDMDMLYAVQNPSANEDNQFQHRALSWSIRIDKEQYEQKSMEFWW